MSGHHSHSHEHNPKDYNKLFIIGIFLNLGFVFVELIYGFISDSLSLIADAGHNFSDVFSLVLAWTANILSAKPSTEKRTYGLKKITIIASLASAIILMITVIAMVWEAV
ncbi:MAG: cation transporter, partial [Leptospiraceae bacterium]|nr:cation transporter [Leptospiraceae bacterium]